ncbi:MAG: hypothetical protein GX491_06680 [Chloroflexi bacterium]|nr:hypothetical protein [Chloroflexota bacterium]
MDNMAAPPFVLTIAYWLHMLATVVWIGGLAAVSLIVLPAAQSVLDRRAYSDLLTRMQVRLQQVGWFSLGLLFVTGLFQMSSSPAYEGFLAINNSWAVAILVKHLVIGLMILVSAYITWGLMPALQRAALARSIQSSKLKGVPTDPESVSRLERREVWLLRLNLLLSALVLALTAWARASV